MAVPAMVGGAALGAGGIAVAVQSFTGNAGLAWAALVAGAALIGIAAWRATQRAREQRADLRRALQALARGDTSQRVDAGRLGEFGGAASALNRVAEVLVGSSERIAALGEHLERLPEELGAAVAEIERGAEDQEAAVEETASLLANINSSIRSINGEVESLARSNEETAASIQEMSVATEEVAKNAVSLQETVESSTSSLHEMGANIRRVAESSDDVQRVAEETAAAITQMDRAIQEVGEHARGASDLTKRVTSSAEEGSQAVGATISGIAAIRDQTLSAKGALEGLALSVGEIGEIATVIGSISDETNLLSLNAAIIAAQAGEHGKAFAVVADQVKTLAQRTSSSAKQIEEMIRGVQDGSARAVDAMAAGIDRVEEGVSRSQRAGEALSTILSLSGDASAQVGEIARATEEQARNSKHVAGAAQRVSDHVQHISQAMGEQTRASETLLRNSNSSLEMCRQMARAMDEQRSSGRYITSNSASITEMIGSIQGSTASHEQASAGLGTRFENLLENARRSCERIPQVTRIAEGLQSEARRARQQAAASGQSDENDRPQSAAESPAR